MQGFKPRPPCGYFDSDHVQCSNVSAEKSPFCDSHKCRFEDCRKCVEIGKPYCTEHACEAEECQQAKLNEKQMYCHNHACFKCLEQDLVACEAYDDRPRNTCEKHPLCCASIRGVACENIATTSGKCADHSTRCKGVARGGKPCLKFVTSREMPFCPEYKSQYQQKVESLSRIASCVAITKKGQPCKGTKLPNMRSFTSRELNINRLYTRTGYTYSGTNSSLGIRTRKRRFFRKSQTRRNRDGSDRAPPE